MKRADWSRERNASRKSWCWGVGYAGHAIFYVGVADVEAALKLAEMLGGKRVLGPAKRSDGGLVVGQFTDPEGHLIGVAGWE